MEPRISMERFALSRTLHMFRQVVGVGGMRWWTQFSEWIVYLMTNKNSSLKSICQKLLRIRQRNGRSYYWSKSNEAHLGFWDEIYSDLSESNLWRIQFSFWRWDIKSGKWDQSSTWMCDEKIRWEIHSVTCVPYCQRGQKHGKPSLPNLESSGWLMI